MLYIASDHAGYQLKKYLIRYLKIQLKKKVVDLGPEKYDGQDDFPDYAIPLAKKVVAKKDNLGVLICGAGHGMCIAANKIRGVRASIGYSIEGAERGRKEDHLNILCLAGRFLSNDHAAAIVKKFLESEPDMAEKRVRRMKKIAAIER